MRQRWGQWRVYYLTAGGHASYMPASWTDIGPKDPFLEQSHSRAIARIEDLLELVKMTEKNVKEIMPHV